MGGAVRTITLFLAMLVTAVVARAADIPLIDAHSQIDDEGDIDQVVPLMDKAGVRRTLLATRGKRHWRDIVALADKFPGRITPSVRTKGVQYEGDTPRYHKLLAAQLARPQFGAMAELILWHAQKGRFAPEMIVEPDAPQVQRALKAALAKGWPFIPHIEFAAAEARGDGRSFMRKLEAMMAAHPDHPFALIHMGQLGPDEATRLIAAHRNVHFITSHANPVTVSKSNQPWTELFDGDAFKPAWRALLLRYPDRFILGFDNVFADHWSEDYYVRQALFWQRALATLPPDVAHAVAHRNAERLWRLPPEK